MNDITKIDGGYGEVIEPATFRIQRMLPGPIERVWAYLTESELRRQWLAAGDMTLQVDAPFEFVWRNDELTEPPGERPSWASQEHRMESRIVELEPPRRLSITWGSTGGVTFELEPQGGDVLLTVTHRRAPDRGVLVNFSSGWHAHLDVLTAKLRGETPAPFWDAFSRVRADYEARTPQAVAE